jgi:hypothetical protein
MLSKNLNQEIRLNVGNLYQTAFWPEIQTQDLTSTKEIHPIYYTINFQGKKRIIGKAERNEGPIMK